MTFVSLNYVFSRNFIAFDEHCIRLRYTDQDGTGAKILELWCVIGVDKWWDGVVIDSDVETIKWRSVFGLFKILLFISWKGWIWCAKNRFYLNKWQIKQN